MNPHTAAALLAELAHGIPALPHAACRDRREVFDSLDPDHVAQAVEVCARCPDLEPCRRWAEVQPPRSLLGVVGGTLHQYDFRYVNKEKESTR